MSDTYLIAEAGSSHDGELEKARDLVQAAADAGASAIKLQYWSSSQRLADRRRAYSALHMYETYRMPRAWLDTLAGMATIRGLDFMATCYLPEDIQVVAPYVDRFKVASFEATDTNFILDHLIRHGDKQTIVSTGMMTEEELERLRFLKVYSRGRLKLLHCVSAYPTPLEALNLDVLQEMDGFSDHTANVNAGGWAVLAGARIVEVHFRLDTTRVDNPDYPHSHSPAGLAAYINVVKEAEVIMGTGEKVCQEAEAGNARYRVGT